MKRTVAFDFDGTYTRHDSLPLMLKHAFGWERYLAGLLMCLPWIILFKLGIISAPLGLATFSDAFTFALLIIILVVKPTGLFGEKVTDKV